VTAVFVWSDLQKSRKLIRAFRRSSPESTNERLSYVFCGTRKHFEINVNVLFLHLFETFTLHAIQVYNGLHFRLLLPHISCIRMATSPEYVPYVTASRAVSALKNLRYRDPQN
jgi:hypothetical protein